MERLNRFVTNAVKPFERLFTGHLNIGKRLTVYGNNAMRWGVTFWTKKYGYVCFRLPFRSFGKWWPLYFYLSPNATPWAATFMIGRRHEDNWVLARIRCRLFGHNFDLDEFNEEYGVTNYHFLRAINDTVGVYKSSYYESAKEYSLED